jgi:CubicO group peptidase (beta-lactamase class C family)
MLFEEGKWHFDDPVTRFVPEFKSRRVFKSLNKAYAESKFMTAASSQDAIDRIAKLPLVSQPGVHWSYSAAADIQGYIVERISGLPLSDFLQSRIFAPLRMNDTGFYVPASKNSRFLALKSYDAATKALVAPGGVLMFDYSRPPSAASGGAGLVSQI